MLCYCSCGTRQMSEVWQGDGIVWVWNFGTVWLGLRERLRGQPCWTWPSLSGVTQLLIQCSWNASGGSVAFVSVQDLGWHQCTLNSKQGLWYIKDCFFFFLLCCVSYCIWNILFDPRWWCGYLIPAAHQELSHSCPNNWPGFKGVTTQGLKGK